MSEPLVEKSLAAKVMTNTPLKVVDDQGRVIGSAYIEGDLDLTLVIDKHHPVALDLETDNGLANIRLEAVIKDNALTGLIIVGG